MRDLHADYRLDDPLAEFLAVAVITGEHLRLHDGARVQVHGVFRQIDHVGRAILGPANLRIRVMGVLPLRIAHLLAHSMTVEATQLRAVGRLQTRLAGQPLHIAPITLLGIALAQTAQAGIGLDDTRVDPQVPAFEQTVSLQRGQHQGKHPFKAVAARPLPDADMLECSGVASSSA